MALGRGQTGGAAVETLYVDIAARADQLIQDAEEAVQAVVKSLDRVEEKTKETQKAWSRLGGFIKTTLAMATGIHLANFSMRLVGAVVGFGKALINTNKQMQMFQKSFEVLTGSAEEAAETIDWVREQAKRTPFDVPGLIQASQMLMTWGLDLKEWFTIVGDVAAGMNRPISQVVNAVGTLATGQTGEAVRRFRDLGINLREFAELEFDARGALVTPLQEAIPIVRQIMIDRFGGMMESQSKTWEGIMSNMMDTWEQFVQVMGQPLFETLNELLIELSTWIDENADKLEDFARDAGQALGALARTLIDIVKAFSAVVNLVDEIIKKITGVPDWVKTGVKAGRELAGIVAGPVAADIEFIGSLIAGRSIEESAERARDVWVKTMLDVGGHAQEAAEAGEVLAENLTEPVLAGLQAVQDRYEEVFGRVPSLEEAQRVVEIGHLRIQQIEQRRKAMQEGMITPAQFQSFVRGTETMRELAETYDEVHDRTELLAGAIAAVDARTAEWNENLRLNLELAGKVAEKLTDKLRKAVEAYEEAMAAAVAKTQEAIEQIEAEALRKEAEVTARHQSEISRLRDDFAREQLRRRQQFNRDWARLVREQNQEVLDAEWEYEFQKRGLLIEGDEVALAELEARYKHESEVRRREHGDERDDLRERYDVADREQREAFERQLAEAQQRLDAEIEAIRAEAREEVQARKDALEEQLANEREKLQERLEAIGENLAAILGDNQTATGLILAAWETMYGAQVTAAITAGIEIRRDLDLTISKALEASAALAAARRYAGRHAARPSTLVRRRRRRTTYTGQEGGYTPGEAQPVETHPGEFLATASTTRRLEQAVGGPLNQQRLQQLALSRRLDVFVRGAGVPADLLRDLREDLAAAFRDEGEDFLYGS